MNRRIFLIALTCSYSTLGAGLAEDESEIRHKTNAYVEAYNRQDAKAITNLWGDNALYYDSSSDDLLTGKNAIQSAFETRFQKPLNGTLSLKINSITFPSENKAIEVGSFTLNADGRPAEEKAFKAFFERSNSTWVLSEIREADIAPVPDQYQHLKPLEWLVGEWIDADDTDDTEIRTTYAWDESKNFIFGSFTMSTEGIKELSGKHIIGWDAAKQVIRAWVFDSDGGFSESTWNKKGPSWIIDTAQTLSDGSRASATNIITPIDNNSYRWEAESREVGGFMLPDISPIVIKRKNG